jgi:isoquinoline 1-oxidoreductase
MVYGKIVPPPARLGASITAVDDTNAKTVPGYLTTLTLDFPPEARDTIVPTVLVIAKTFPAAMRAAKLVEVEWSLALDQQLSSDQLEKESESLLKEGGSGLAFVRTGSVETARNESARRVSATYKTGMVAQAPMEPESCLAEHIDGIWNIYAGSQCGNLDRLVLAGFLQTSAENINFHPHYIGGGFGARFFRQTSILAAIAAKTLSKPTKVIFSREDDMALTSPRSPTVQTLTAFLSAKNEVIGLEHDIATAFNRIPMMETSSVDNKGNIDIYTANGSDHWYDIPNHSVNIHRATHIENVVKVGPVRGVSNNYTVFAVESMLDEIAHEIKVDPLTLRLSLLNGIGANAGSLPSEKATHKLPALFGIPGPNWKKWEFRPVYHPSTNVGGGKRLANALRVSTGLAGYGTKLLSKHSGQGIAVTAAEERHNSTFCACTAEVSVNLNDGKIDVRKLTVAIDVGLVVNPDGIRAQVEGSLLWGLSNTLQEELTVDKGSFTQDNFDTYRWQTIADVPELDIHILENGLHPSGAGEPATSVVGAAIANAVFNAVGVRIRTLPIRREDIVKALRAS